MAVTVEDMMELDNSEVIESAEAKRERSLANLKPFKPGQSGNPKGRPKGCRNKLSERFLEDMHDLWKRRGMQVLESVAEKQPEKLLSAMVQVLPKDFQVSITDDNEQRWVIDARPLSVEEWQRSHALPDTGNTQALESKTCSDKVQMSSKAGASDGDCAMVDAGYLVGSD